MSKNLLENFPELQDTVSVSLRRFVNKPFDERLGNHELTGKLRGLWAFCITEDIRIVYRWKDDNHVQILTIGPHTVVYSPDLY